jgi:hypothetical protein
MMVQPKILTILIMAAVLAASGTAFAKKSDLPDITEEGLHRVPDSKLALVYAAPGADLKIYQRVKLMDAYVAFRKNWERDQRSTATSRISISSRDIERIKDNLAQEFQVVFSQTLKEGGYELVDESEEDVLLVRPAIINLDVKAPETSQAGRTMTYVDSAGEMTLYLELYDSVTGDLIAKALDRRVDNSRAGMYTWANSVTNRAAADRILKGWAEILLDALNEAKQ